MKTAAFKGKFLWLNQTDTYIEMGELVVNSLAVIKTHLLSHVTATERVFHERRVHGKTSHHTIVNLLCEKKLYEYQHLNEVLS